jgi:origin recognition complex subunit 2
MPPSAKRRRVTEPNGSPATPNGTPSKSTGNRSSPKSRAGSPSGDEQTPGLDSQPIVPRSRHADAFGEASDSSLSSEDEEEDKWATSTPFVVASAGDAYLQAMARTSKTSNNRLSDRVEPFKLSSFTKAVEQAYKVAKSIHKASWDTLLESYEERFGQWLFELLQGFSLLFHGVGSKLELINTFVSIVLQRRGDVVVLNGYVASINIADLLAAIEAQILQDEVTAGKGAKSGDKLHERARRLVDRLAELPTRRPLFLVVHNLDAPSLRNQRAQSILALLASQPQIHLLASVDHINSTLLLPSTSTTGRQRGFNFIHHHLPTFATYLSETTLSNIPATLFPPSVYPSSASSMKGSRGKSTAQSTMFVLASVTPHARRMFKVLMDHQLEATLHLGESQLRTADSQIADAESTPSFAMLYGSLFVKGRDGFFASSTGMLDALLQEFRDHGIVLASEKPPEGDGQLETDEAAEQGRREWLWIGMPRRQLVELKESLEDEG